MPLTRVNLAIIVSNSVADIWTMTISSMYISIEVNIGDYQAIVRHELFLDTYEMIFV